MWFTDFPLGIGMCMMTDCMHTFSPLIQIDYGGIGALTIFTDPDGASAGDGLLRGIIAVGIPIIGMAVLGWRLLGHHPWHHHHHYPGYGWGGGYWGGGHGWYGSSAHRPGIHAGRYNNNYNSSRPNRNNYVNNYGRTNSSSYVGRSEGGRTSQVVIVRLLVEVPVREE